MPPWQNPGAQINADPNDNPWQRAMQQFAQAGPGQLAGAAGPLPGFGALPAAAQMAAGQQQAQPQLPTFSGGPQAPDFGAGLRFAPGFSPGQSLGDLGRWANNGGVDFRSTGTLDPVTGFARVTADPNAGFQQQLALLEAYNRTLANQGQVAAQASDAGLRAVNTFGATPGLLQGNVGGSLANDASRVQIERERHADTLSRQTRIDQAVLQYSLANPTATQSDIVRYRQTLERSIPATNPLVDALGVPAGGAGGGAYGPVPGAPGAYQGGPAAPGAQPGANPIAPRAGYNPPAAQPWETQADRLDQEFNRILQAYPAPGAPGARPTQIDPARTGDAIADLVTSLGQDYVSQNIQALHPYLIHRFGGPTMDRWFTQRYGVLGRQTPSERARDMLIAALNARGANIGVNTGNPESSAIPRLVDSILSNRGQQANPLGGGMAGGALGGM